MCCRVLRCCKFASIDHRNACHLPQARYSMLAVRSHWTSSLNQGWQSSNPSCKGMPSHHNMIACWMTLVAWLRTPCGLLTHAYQRRARLFQGNAQPSKKDLLNPSTSGVKCARCGESAQLNFVLANTAAESPGGGGATGGNGTQVLPWIEVAVKAAETK